jgi:hypothetical protein
LEQRRYQLKENDLSIAQRSSSEDKKSLVFSPLKETSKNERSHRSDRETDKPQETNDCKCRQEVLKKKPLPKGQRGYRSSKVGGSSDGTTL